MLARIRDRNVWVVYAVVLLLGVAYGISIALTALFLDHAGFGKTDIGKLAAAFASGIVAASFPAGWLVRRFSAKTTLVAAALGYAVCVTAFPYAHGFAAVAAVRFVDGACSVAVWVAAETVLLARAEREHKAFVMSLYAISLAVGYVVGPLAAHAIVAGVPMHRAFVVSGALAATAGVVGALALDGRRSLAEHVHENEASDEGAGEKAPRDATFASVAWRIKTSALATFSYGYFQASVVLFLPLFLIESKGISEDRTILVPAFFAAGMLLFANVAGRVGDRVGHLLVMRTQAAIGLAMIVGFVVLDAYAAMCVAVFVAGATLAAISPVSLALQGVVVAPRDYARANSVYNACYAAGMLVGPPISSVLFARGGGVAMLLHLAALWTVFVVVTWIFRADDPRYRKAHAVATLQLPSASSPRAQ